MSNCLNDIIMLSRKIEKNKDLGIITMAQILHYINRNTIDKESYLMAYREDGAKIVRNKDLSPMILGGLR